MDVSKYSSARQNKWRQAVDLIKRYPITGVGINQFKQAVIYHNLGESEHIAHNAFLEIGAETGIVNMALFLMLLFSHIKNYFKNYLLFYRKNDVSLALTTRAIFTAILIFTFCLLFLSEQYNSMLYILLGLAVGCEKLQRIAEMKTSLPQ